MKWSSILAMTAALCGAQLNFSGTSAEAPWVFCCSPENDLYVALKAGAGIDARRAASPAEAVAQAPDGAGVLILAAHYPARQTPLDSALLEAAARKKLRLYVEYPAWLPDLTMGSVQTTRWERVVVTSKAFGPDLPPLRILMVPDCHYVPVEAPSSHLAAARVAGFDSAVLGLPGKNVWPLLFEHPRGNLLVAATRLSQFRTGRYAPADAWPPVWRMILSWLAPAATVPELKWTPAVVPNYGRDLPLPADAQREAIRRGTDWYTKARLLVHRDWADKLEQMPQHIERVEAGPTPQMPVGDGTYGILEAFSSAIQQDGSQPVRWYVRADCNSEAAAALALRGVLDHDARSQVMASNLLDYVDFKSIIQGCPRADPKSPSFGLMGWDTRPMGATVYYGDDNARAVLGQIAAAAALRSDRWDEAILRCILANFRTTGPSGFRNARIEEPELQNQGWRWFWERSDGSWGGYRECPHYQAYQWAANLWLYQQTKFEPLLAQTKRGIRQMMKVYPNGWQAESAREEGERCRMLLPLAWLVRVENTPEHRQWLQQVFAYIREVQDASGAIQQRVTHTAGRNEEYGTGECALIHANGDPGTDLLYGANFALLGLREAAAATGDPEMQAAENRLAQFLIRIQARAAHPVELDGVWFRGFDYRRWDYWGSNGDVGWGVWATETGWTQGWIATVLALRELRSSLWDFTANSTIERHMAKWQPIMLPEEALNRQKRTIRHSALGKTPQLTTAPAGRYAAGGPASLCDGELGSEYALLDQWLGWQGADMVAVIDLGESQPLRRVSARFLQQVSSGVFLPPTVEFASSEDGRNYQTFATARPSVAAKEPGPLIHEIQADGGEAHGRFIRVKAKNFGTIPQWQKRAPGAPAWLFCDEILVNPQP